MEFLVTFLALAVIVSLVFLYLTVVVLGGVLKLTQEWLPSYSPLSIPAGLLWIISSLCAPAALLFTFAK